MHDGFKRLDLVRLNSGSEMIVTGFVPSRPKNPFLGVKPNGNGAEYKFGWKHGPKRIGTVEETHPALVALARRNGGVMPQDKKALSRLLDAIDQGDLEAARAIAPLCRGLVG